MGTKPDSTAPNEMEKQHHNREVLFQRLADAIDLVFWFVAVWFSVFLVKRPLSRSERLAIGMYEFKS